ncbi:beta-lysine 5,6-aminomutase beta subunit [Actinomadura pelletieri DSM 43383]|uniref:Beta-lysine 5,6-aminomutase beta subunit n=1 Tax=Actinomadura pelletieri DSM 43383 TaxID=1120940 RepID=A0A495QLJ5_9ACTN|nr:OAM dimerization domain-containing protein [Actinomadura pelletieri]RKS73455.1 beta-lysine 5,6-aminomutase beta subunit [Actinomadura pelletieri DSM 43383]
MTVEVPGPHAPTDPADTRQVIRPYGDTTGDGMVQMSFTLPVPAGKRADAAALQLAGKMGLDPASVVHSKPMGPDFTFFIVYGKARHLVDYASIPVPEERAYPLLTSQEVNLAIRRTLNRRLVVVGACIGTDAHTVGIDAILNVKGFAGEKGLEYYREIQVVNMGAQVTVAELVRRAKAENADAVLVSQVVTQRNAHLHNTKQMAAAFHAEYPTAVAGGMGRPLLVVGGPRFDTVTETDLGVDRIFGRGTTPAEVASYLVHALLPAEAAPLDETDDTEQTGEAGEGR